MKRIRMIVACVAMASALLVAVPARADASKADPTGRWIAAGLADGSIVGASVARITRERVDARGYGRRALPDGTTPDADTQFQLGSITKVFTHLLLAEMAATGDVARDRTIGSLMPAGFAPKNPAVASITLAALSTHTSGLPRLPSGLPLADPDPYARFDAGDLVRALEAARDKQPLGHFYAYSNFGVGVLGQLLGQVDGKGYADALERRVLAPLGLRHTAMQPGDDAASASSGGKTVAAWRFDALAGAGALWGSAADLARLVQAYLGTHEHRMVHALEEDLVVAAGGAGAHEVTPVWHVARAGKAPVYWHNGGTAGFHSFVGFRPDTRLGIAILVTGDADPTRVGLDALGAAASRPQPAAHDAALHGQYALTPVFGLGVYERDGALVAQATGQQPFLLHPVGDDWYAIGEVDASVHFVREGDAVVALELAQNGVVQRAKRVAATAVAATRKAVPVDAGTLAGYVGVYGFAPGVALTVRRTRDRLEAQLTGQSYLPVFARGKDRFFYEAVDAELAFERDETGAVSAVVLHQGGVEQRAARLPDP